MEETSIGAVLKPPSDVCIVAGHIGLGISDHSTCECISQGCDLLCGLICDGVKLVYTYFKNELCEEGKELKLLISVQRDSACQSLTSLIMVGLSTTGF